MPIDPQLTQNPEKDKINTSSSNRISIMEPISIIGKGRPAAKRKSAQSWDSTKRQPSSFERAEIIVDAQQSRDPVARTTQKRKADDTAPQGRAKRVKITDTAEISQHGSDQEMISDAESDTRFSENEQMTDVLVESTQVKISCSYSLCFKEYNSDEVPKDLLAQYELLGALQPRTRNRQQSQIYEDAVGEFHDMHTKFDFKVLAEENNWPEHIDFDNLEVGVVRVESFA